jgi:hypothetical protein
MRETFALSATQKAPLETQLTASQRAIGRAEAEGHTTNPPAASAEAPPVTDVAHLVGLSQTDATKLFGLPAERRNLPPSEIWTYHSMVCDVKLFFYPEVGGPDFRALTFQIDERGASDATHNACLSSPLGNSRDLEPAPLGNSGASEPEEPFIRPPSKSRLMARR